jgi:hypothetical protein
MRNIKQALYSLADMAKRRSLLQKSQSYENLKKMNNGNKENVNPNLSTHSTSNSGSFLLAKNQIELERVRAEDYKRRLHNERRALQRSRKSQDKLRAQVATTKDDLASVKEDLAWALDKTVQLKRDKNTLRMCCVHAPGKLAKAVQKAKTHQVKEKGVITDVDREMV